MNDGPYALAFMHEVEGSVDIVERHRIGDEFVDFDVTIHVLLNHSR